MRRVVLVALLVSACAHSTVALPLPLPSPTPTLSPSASPTASPRPAPTHRPTVRATPAPTRRTARPSPKPSPRPPLVPTCPRVPNVGSATQVVLVVGSGSSATVRACQLRAGRWVSVLGTAYGHVGLHGVAPAGAKREGDDRTPSGVFSLGRGFGVLSDPGVRFGWRRTTRADVWVDDVHSALYNTWQENPANGRWASAEPLYVPGTYDYVQAIGYNTARVPGLGSAIFLHVDHHSGTTGCVSAPRAQLLAILRWERPGAVIVIR